MVIQVRKRVGISVQSYKRADANVCRGYAKRLVIKFSFLFPRPLPIEGGPGVHGFGPMRDHLILNAKELKNNL